MFPNTLTATLYIECWILPSFGGWDCFSHLTKLIKVYVLDQTCNACKTSALVEIIPALTQTDVEIFNYIVHANQGTQSGRQVWEANVGDKWETSVNSAQRTQSGRQVWETRMGRMILHLSPTCPSHLGALGPHEFTLVSP